MDLRAEIASAVSVALSPGPEQASGYAYLERIKNESGQTWQSCLDIFLAGSSGADGHGWTYTYPPEARMFGLQVVDDALQTRFDTLDSNEVLAIQGGLLDYVKREYVQGNAEGQLFYLRNKVVHTLFLLFMQTYTSTWPNFFQSFIALLPSSSSSTEPFNPKITDLLLRLLHEISVEVSDSTLRLNKAHARLARDTELRDAVRARDAPAIADQLVKVLAYALERVQQPSSQLGSQQAVELAAMSMNVLADHASWIDISLVVTPTMLPLLFQCLQQPHVSIRLASADFLYEIVTKGMPPTDKLQVLDLLNVSDIIEKLLDADDTRKATASHANGSGSPVPTAGDSEADELFREKLARVLNGLGVELTKIVDEASATDAQKETAKQAALAQRPLALRFLADEYDDTSLTVIPFLQNLMTLYKKEKKRAAATHLTQEKADFLRALLQTTIRKMRYSTEEEWSGDDDDDDDDCGSDSLGDDEAKVAFQEMRKNLRTLFDAVAWIDYELFCNVIKQLIVGTLDEADRPGGSTSLEWKDVEVALYVLYVLGESASKEKGVVGAAAFVQVPPEEFKKARVAPEHKINYSQYPPSALGELLLRTLQSNASSFPHPSVPLQLFECVSRYHDFFQLAPETIMRILPAFLDERGLHQKKRSIRCRCFYLFDRFIHNARHQLAHHLDARAITDICTRVQDLLVIQASLPAPETPNEDVLSKAARRGSPFDSQLYLFDALGSLISILPSSASQIQVTLLSALLEPILRDIASIGSTPDSDQESLLRLHHLIKAVGSVAYGFPELRSTTAAPDAAWVPVMYEATKVILDSLKAKSHVAIIRESSLGAFKNVVARTGEAALPLVAPLIDCLIDQLTAAEVVEFLPFIGMLVHRYKTTFADMLDVLLAPVFDRTYYFLEQPIQGTDDIQQHSELRRAYFSLLLSICNAGMQSVFLSTRNAPRLENLLQSLPHYLTNGALLLDQKFGYAVVNKLVAEWVVPLTPPPAPAVTPVSALPQYKDFVYEHLIRVSLELPVQVSFDYGDAQAYVVIGEIANLFKSLYLLRGQEFVEYLRTSIFPAFGVPEETVQVFLTNLTQSADGRGFKKWLAPFFQKAKQTSNDKPYSVAHLLDVVSGSS